MNIACITNDSSLASHLTELLKSRLDIDLYVRKNRFRRIGLDEIDEHNPSPDNELIFLDIDTLATRNETGTLNWIVLSRRLNFRGFKVVIVSSRYETPEAVMALTTGGAVNYVRKEMEPDEWVLEIKKASATVRPTIH